MIRFKRKRVRYKLLIEVWDAGGNRMLLTGFLEATSSSKALRRVISIAT